MKRPTRGAVVWVMSRRSATRIRRSAVVLVAAITVLSLGVAGCHRESHEQGLRPEQSQAMDRLLASQMTANQIPGLAAAVIKDGKVVKRVTLGVANVQTRAPITGEVPFQLSSTTKSFTATSVLLLVSDGRLHLSDRLGDLLEGLPPPWQSVTVRQLLSHTSGLPDITRRSGELDLIADSWEAALPMLVHAPLQFAPGDRWSYTQTNYVLLARIVEHVSGKTIEAFMNERLFQPLGMKHTFFVSPGDTRSRVVNYERSDSGQPVPRHLEFPPYVHAAGGLSSSLDDLIMWNAALDSGRLLKPELTREMWATTSLNDGSKFRIDGKTIGYGLGWVVDDSPGHRSVGHSGGNSTGYRRFIDEKFTIVVLHNGVMDPDGLIDSIAAIVRSAPGGDGSTAQTRLWDAAMSGDTAEIVRALKDGADIEALDTRKSRNGRRALNWAACFNRPEAIHVLLEHGAKIDAENLSGFTALHHAAETGSLKAAEVLLSAGANPIHANRAGERPADTARRHGHTDVAARIDAAKTR